MAINNDAGVVGVLSSTKLALDRMYLAHDRTTMMAAMISLLGILALIAIILRQ